MRKATQLVLHQSTRSVPSYVVGFLMSSFIIVELAWRWPGGGEAQGRAGRRDAVCRGKGMAEKICGEEEMWDPEHGGREAGLQLPIYHIELLFGSVEAII